MIDPELERSLQETRELHQRWSQFREFCKMAMSGEHQITQQAEMKFMELKSRIAMLHDGFLTKLTQEVRTGQNIMNIVRDCILLKRVANYSDAEKQKFEFDWNEGYILLTEQIGTMEEKQKELAAINEGEWRRKKQKELWVARVNNLLKNGLFRAGLFVIGLPLLLWLIPTVGLYDYRNFGKMNWSRKPYEQFISKFWRPYLNNMFEYSRIESIPQTDYPPKDNPTIVSQPIDNMPELGSSVFAEIGIAQGDGDRASELLARKNEVKKLRFNVNGQDVLIWEVLFERTEQAQAFSKLVKSDPHSNENQLRRVYLSRHANLLYVGVSDGTFPEQYWRERFKAIKSAEFKGWNKWRVAF